MTGESRRARDVVERVLQAGLADDAETFAGLMAIDGYIEWPFHPPGVPARVEGRMAIRQHLARVATGPIRLREYRDMVIHETLDAEVVIVEYRVHGTVVANDAPCEQTVIAVFRVRDGQVVTYRDYVDPLRLMAALG